ncbi:MAG: HK97 gp10 family phage protein [Ruminiclostridium sp.]|nr:HK97 gp10 family phage protein [Ruminiclostridium sp.]
MKDYTAEINAAVAELGRIAYEEARRICPVRTGRLKNSISRRELYDMAKGLTSVVIGTDVPYARAVEIGAGKRKPRHYLGGGAELAARMAPAVFTIYLGGKSRW